MTVPRALIEKLKTARRVVLLTGAGVSAESGVPTFRDAQTGLWAQYDPAELATPRAFQRQPRLVWEWYAWRRQLIAEAQPNPAHRAIVELESLFPEFHLITQNIDNLHQRAGSRDVVELHGNITRTKCFDEDTLVSDWPETDEVPPTCPRCGGLLRPDVVWFEELLPAAALQWAGEVSASCDVFFSVGTSGMVYPAAGLAADALNGGATVVEINPQSTPLTPHAHFALAGAAGLILPKLVGALR